MPKMFIVLYRKRGDAMWKPTHRVFTDELEAVDDADDRFETNKGFNRGLGYEYQVDELVPTYTVSTDEAICTMKEK
ncbi:MAG TPA: hypothetical protein VIY48_00155 [Candidatus Paceibacterota bacterium]